MAVNQLRYDPTRTTMLRRAFLTQMNRRWAVLKHQIKVVLVDRDDFDLSPKPIANAGRFEFHTDAQKLAAFNQWLQDRINEGILTVGGGIKNQPWTAKYIDSAYRKGLIRAFADGTKAGLTDPKTQAGRQIQFLKDSFDTPEARGKIELLSTRTFENLKGITAATAAKLNTAFADGLAQRLHPLIIAKGIETQIDGIGVNRSRTLARTEVIHAHAEGQIDSFEALGVDELGLLAEYSTAGDSHVCPLCSPLEGVVITVAEARGLIPRHPNCRCSWVPWVDGINDKRGKKLGKKAQQAIDESIQAQHPKDTLEEAKRKTPWLGADRVVDKQEPKPQPEPEPTPVEPEQIKPNPEQKPKKERPADWIDPKYEKAVIDNSEAPKPAYWPEKVPGKTFAEVEYHNEGVRYIHMYEMEKRQASTTEKINIVREKLSAANDALEAIRLETAQPAKARREAAQTIHQAREDLYDLAQQAAGTKGAEAKRFQKLKDAKREEIRNLETKLDPVWDKIPFAAKTPGEMSVKPQVEYPDSMLARAQQSAKFYSKVMDKSHGSLTVGLDFAADGRAYYGLAGTVHMASSDGVEVYAHEMGHFLEDVSAKSKEIQTLVRGFLHHRLQNANVEQFGGMFKGSEVGAEDDFRNAFGGHGARYVGKYYPHATEIMSMGIQKLAENPSEFADLDPEFFKFVIGVLGGHLW